MLSKSQLLAIWGERPATPKPSAGGADAKANNGENGENGENGNQEEPVV